MHEEALAVSHWKDRKATLVKNLLSFELHEGKYPSKLVYIHPSEKLRRTGTLFRAVKQLEFPASKSKDVIDFLYANDSNLVDFVMIDEKYDTYTKYPMNLVLSFHNEEDYNFVRLVLL